MLPRPRGNRQVLPWPRGNRRRSEPNTSRPPKTTRKRDFAAPVGPWRQPRGGVLEKVEATGGENGLDSWQGRELTGRRGRRSPWTMTEAPRTAAPPPSVDDAREEGRRRARHRHSRQGRGSGDGSRGDAVLPAAGRTVDGPWTRRHGRPPPWRGRRRELGAVPWRWPWGEAKGDRGRRRARRARRRPRRVAGETVRGDPADDVDGGDDGDGDGVRRSGGKTRRGGERGDDRWDRGRREASVRRGRGCRDSCRRNVGSLPAPEKGEST